MFHLHPKRANKKNKKNKKKKKKQWRLIMIVNSVAVTLLRYCDAAEKIYFALENTYSRYK